MGVKRPYFLSIGTYYKDLFMPISEEAKKIVAKELGHELRKDEPLMDINAVKQRLGHSSAAFTLDTIRPCYPQNAEGGD